MKPKLPPPPPEGGTPAGSGTVPDIGGGAGGSFVAPTSLAAYLDDQICDALRGVDKAAAE